jgi:hypothetical protein
MDTKRFRESLAGASPPVELAPPVAALWQAAKGDWDGAHRLVQDESSGDAAWVHAYLHRVEGDLSNAGYWYRRAGKPVASGPLDEEWEAIATALLSGDG